MDSDPEDDDDGEENLQYESHIIDDDNAPDNDEEQGSVAEEKITSSMDEQIHLEEKTDIDEEGAGQTVNNNTRSKRPNSGTGVEEYEPSFTGKTYQNQKKHRK